MTVSFLRGDPPLLDERFPLPLNRPFSTAQAAAEGVNRRLLGALVRQGLLRRPTRGVYLPVQVEETRDVRVQVVALAVPPGCVVTDWTATYVWTGVDHPGAREAPRPVSAFCFAGDGRVRRSLVTSGERDLRTEDVEPLVDGLLVTRPVRTALDLGRFSSPVLALGGMDALARHGGFAAADLCAQVERFARQRGVVQLRVLAPEVDGRAESPGESALRWRWLQVPGMPRPQLQIPVYAETGRELFRVDLGVEELRFGAEYDGEEWHSSVEQKTHDRARRSTLRDVFGWAIEVFERDHVYGPREDATYRLPPALSDARRSVAIRRAAATR